MRAALVLPLLALALISTADAQQGDQRYPKNCQACWRKGRDSLESCSNLSKEDMDRLATLTDAEITEGGDDSLGPIKACICELTENADRILQRCDNRCPPEMANGLRTECTIMSSTVCSSTLAKQVAKEGNEEDTDSSTSGEKGNEPEGEGTATNSEEPAQDGKNAPDSQTGGASSVQWSGAILTVVAAVVAAVAL